jgi:hypothetical protein
LDAEGGFAILITESLKSLAKMADEAQASSEGYTKARNEVRSKRDYLEKIRSELTRHELENRNILSPESKKKSWSKRLREFLHL